MKAKFLLLVATIGTCRADLIVNQAFAGAFQSSAVLTGLNYPLGLSQLGDGSLIFGTTTPAAGSGGVGQFAFYLGAGNVSRYAGGISTVIASNLPGAVTGVQPLGNNTIVVSTIGNQTFGGFRMADLTFLSGSGNSYTNVGSIHFQYQPAGGAVSLEPVVTQIGPGQYSIVFGLSASGNDGTAGGLVTLSGLISAQLPQGSVDSLTVDVSGPIPVVTNPSELASGIRNTTNPVIDPSGNIFFGDNNYDVNNVVINADELDKIIAGVSGVQFYGYPGNYTGYGTGDFVGGQGIPPIVAFQPLANFDSAGIASLALAPSDFPSGFENGFFVGFHGDYTDGGIANLTDPVGYVDAMGNYVEFLQAGQPGLSHPDSLYSNSNSLYVLNLFTGDFAAGTGEIDVITSAPEPASVLLLCAGIVLIGLRRLCHSIF